MLQDPGEGVTHDCMVAWSRDLCRSIMQTQWTSSFYYIYKLAISDYSQEKNVQSLPGGTGSWFSYTRCILEPPTSVGDANKTLAPFSTSGGSAPQLGDFGIRWVRYTLRFVIPQPPCCHNLLYYLFSQVPERSNSPLF